MRIDKAQADEIVRLVLAGATCREAAKATGRHRTSVERLLGNLGIKVPKGSRPIPCNDEFFSTFRPDSCYWGGMMLADGYIRYDRPVVDLHLKVEDRGHLEKFKGALTWQGGVSKDNRVTVTNPTLVRDLRVNFGVVPQKTPITAFPNQVPRQLQSHLIRGIFDGDGCPTYPVGSVPMVSFVGTVALLGDIQKVLHRELPLHLKSRNEIAPIQPLPSLRYGTEVFGAFWYSGENAAKIVKWMYRDSTPEIRLDRKYERCREWFRL